MKKTAEKQLRKMVRVQQDKLAASVLKKRKAAKLSQQALASLAGIDRKTVNRIENGHFSPSLETMTRMAKVLNTTVVSLVK